MKRFFITAEVPGIGKVQHVIKEADLEGAIKRMVAAHPLCEIVRVDQSWGDK